MAEETAPEAAELPSGATHPVNEGGFDGSPLVLTVRPRRPPPDGTGDGDGDHDDGSDAKKTPCRTCAHAKKKKKKSGAATTGAASAAGTAASTGATAGAGASVNPGWLGMAGGAALAAGAIVAFPAIAGIGAIAGVVGIAAAVLGATSLITGAGALGGHLFEQPGDRTLDSTIGALDKISLATGITQLGTFAGRAAIGGLGRYFGSSAATTAARTAATEATQATGRAASTFVSDGSRLYRVDSRSVATIFEEGFAPLDASGKNFQNYVLSSENSLFVGSSKSMEIVNHPNFVGSSKYVFEIDTSHNLIGVDANQYFASRGMVNPYAREAEIALAGGAPRQSIIGARPILADGTVGELIPNPNYLSPR